MATSSYALFITPLLYHTNSQKLQLQTLNHNNGKSTHLLRLQGKISSTRDFVVRSASPEAAAADLLSSFSLPTIPGFSDNPWITGVAGLLLIAPLLIQWLLTLTKEVDMAAQTVERIADAVGKVAEGVDKAAEDIVKGLPEGGLKRVVAIVENLAEETVKDAQKVEDLMDKVEELDDKLEAFLEKQIKGNEKA